MLDIPKHMRKKVHIKNSAMKILFKKKKLRVLFKSSPSNNLIFTPFSLSFPQTPTNSIHVFNFHLETKKKRLKVSKLLSIFSQIVFFIFFLSFFAIWCNFQLPFTFTAIQLSRANSCGGNYFSKIICVIFFLLFCDVCTAMKHFKNNFFTKLKYN